MNNYLKHTELARARALFDERESLIKQRRRLSSSACLFCYEEEIRLLSAQLDQIALEINELQTSSAANTLALMAACDVGNTTECQTLRDEAAYYLDNTDGWFGMESRLGRVFDVSAGAMEGVDVDWGGNLDRWLTDAYDVAALDSNADWGVIDSSVADYAIARDGWINIGVGTGAVAVSVLGCIGTSGLGCAAIVGGAVLAESNTIYDGAATVITGSSQDGYIKNLLLAADFTDAEADQYERWIENGLAVATIGIDGVIVIRSTSGAQLNTGRQTVSDFVATNRTFDFVETQSGTHLRRTV
ncbi:hypothetical protein [Yoonia sp. I 8.24]|uniref:hypothetical protein n=1 Tax=Yoonia sp. I 8.24 TaxID=1537229 RepID=UPI001EDC9E7D|nr:hypothetical protein [Yoonia sp. I 8.24]MCG3266586.1 hypothetical protein [Yoonia sp. I 8.24]